MSEHEACARLVAVYVFGLGLGLGRVVESCLGGGTLGDVLGKEAFSGPHNSPNLKKNKMKRKRHFSAGTSVRT